MTRQHVNEAGGGRRRRAGDDFATPVEPVYVPILMITKKVVDRGARVKVTFTIPANGSRRVAVVGDFNDWDPHATPMRKRGDVRSASVTLDSGRRYAFRYLGENGHWFNDEHADGYDDNATGDTNGIIDLSATSRWHSARGDGRGRR